MSRYHKFYFEARDILIPHLAATIENIARRNKLKTVLDVGCGTGRLIQYLTKAEFEVAGCDIAKAAVKTARSLNPGLKIVQASATKLPFDNNSFDFVCAISLIEHLTAAEVDLFLSETRRVLTPFGFIFLVTPNFATPLRLIQGKKWFGYTDPTHINFFTPASLVKILSEHQFANFRQTFPISYHPSLDWEFPPPFPKLPKLVKQSLIYLLFSTPLCRIRNSTWILAQKNEENQSLSFN